MREHGPWARRVGGGGGIAVREGQIQLRKIAGKCQKNCGAITKPPEASRSNTSDGSATFVRKRKGHQQARTVDRPKIFRKNGGKWRETAGNGEIAGIIEKNCGPQPPPLLGLAGAHLPPALP